MTKNLSNPPDTNKHQSLFDLLIVIIFIFGINIPLLGSIFKIDPIPNYGRLAPAPKMPHNLRDMARMPGIFKAYYSDNFGFRGSLIYLHGQIMFNVFKVSPSSKVQLGNNSWLFLKSEETLDDWRRLYPFDDEQLDAWQTMLEARHNFLAELGIPYIFVIAPNKHTIYGNNLPDHLKQKNNYSRLDQLIARLQATNSPVNIVDLRFSLQDVSQNHRTYHRTDTHWNLLGAYVGYTKIANQINQLGFPVNIPSLNQMTLKYETVLGGDLARMMGLKQQLTEDRIVVQSFEACKVTYEDGSPLIVEDIDLPGDRGSVTLCPEAKIKKAVVFHDSFGKLLYPYLASQFQRTVFVWSDNFDPQVVKREQPDVVIQELVERRLFNREPNLEEFNN